jgi:glycosyltransferase involved in cell wall biosynthesis
MVTDGRPRVSIVIPTYNRAQRLRRALDSVLAQDFRDFEVLVIDDGSTDDTASVVRSIDDARVKYVAQDNGGPASARNRGVALASGSIITFLDSDDLVLPGWLGAMVAPFTVEGADIVCCGIEVVTESDAAATPAIHLPQPLGPVFGHVQGLFGTAGAYALRKRVLDIAGGFDPLCVPCEHTELAIRLGAMCEGLGLRVHAIMTPYVRYIEHAGARAFGDTRKRLESTRQIITKHGARLRKDRRMLGTYWSIAGVSAHRLGLRALASACFLQAALRHPWRARHWLRYLMSVTRLVPPWVWKRRPAPGRPGPSPPTLAREDR